MKRNYLSITVFITILFVNGESNCQSLNYPSPRKANQEDTYFGTKVNDPYRWMEDDLSAETAAWVKAENELTFTYLDKIPFRDSLRARMTSLWDYPKFTPPFQVGQRYFYYKNEGLQNQSVLYQMPGLNYVPMAYFDPNKLSTDGTISVQQLKPSKNGKYMVFVLSKAGSDWNEIKIKEVANLKTLPETLTRIKFSSIAWKDSGFFYSRYDPEDGYYMTKRNEYHKVYYHRLNTQQSEDTVVFEDTQHALRTFTAYTTPDENYLYIMGGQSSSGNNLIIKDLSKPASEFKNVVDSFGNSFNPVGNIGNELIFLTNYKAPRKRLIAINADNPAELKWKELVPQHSNILAGAYMAGNKLVLHYMEAATSHLYIIMTLCWKRSFHPLYKPMSVVLNR